MSNLSNGDKPKWKEPNPRRRRTKRPANTQSKARSASVDDVATHSYFPPEVSLEGRNPSSNENKDGSSKTAANGLVAGLSRDNEGRRNLYSKSKKRRYAGEHNHNKRNVVGNAHSSSSASQPVPEKLVSKFEVKSDAPDTADVPLQKPQKHVRGNKPLEGKRPNQHAGHKHRYPLNAYAALDLGTNNCRLLIAIPQDRGGFRVIDGFSKIVRLGEGLSQTGRLSQEAMDRSVEALKICAEKLNNRKIKRQRLIATEACRQAANGAEFLARVKRESGLDLEIVTRETEARLATEGCGSLMDKKSDAAVLFDIGGGSSELILVSNIGARKKRISERIAAWTSLPMGVVTLSERFGGQNVSRKIFDEMVNDVMVHINEFEDREVLKHAFAHGRVHLLGTSGTVTTLAGIHLKLPRYDRRRVDGIWLRDEEVDSVIDELLSMSYEERSRNPCIGAERADLVLAGCAILNAIRQTWPTKRLRVADRGLREGLLAEMMNMDKPSGQGRRNQRNSNKRGRNKNRSSNNQQSET